MRSIRAAGDTWSVRLSEEAARDGVVVVLFFCTTTNQRPYRVMEVEQSRVSSPADLDSLSVDELMCLFESSRSMAFPKGYETS